MNRMKVLVIAGAVLLAVTAVTAVWQAPPDTADQPVTVTTAAIRPLNLNTATAEELTAVPGIGTALAGKIVDLRTQAGGFDNIYQLVAVEGITRSMVDAWTQYLTVSDENT